MTHGMAVYITVSMIFFIGAGVHLYQQHKIIKLLKEIREKNGKT